MKWTAIFSFLIFIAACKTPASTTGSDGARSIAGGAPQIRTAQLYKQGDQTSLPAIGLGSTEGLELHFDDMAGDIKNYYYSFQLCNADWSPSGMHPLEYLKGFQTVRISNYRNSSVAATRYTHYQATVPDRSSYPTRSGNYLLRVFLNNDTNQIAFTKRFMVVDNKANVAAQVQQPFNAQYFRTHQKLQVAITTDNRVQVLSPQDLRVVILQNNNWQTAVETNRPSIYRGNYYEYNDEAFTSIPSGKEWRWIDLRSLRLRSDRMESIDTRGDTTHVYVKQDGSRNGQVYVYYRDLNGSYMIETMENVNPFWQGEYGMVHFTYVPPGNRAFEGRDVHLFGELTNYARGSAGKMDFNTETGIYEKSLFLKQGFYNYMYVTLPANGEGFPDFSSTEGNNPTTENIYTILVYYRPFGARADELIGSTTLSSAFGVR